MRFPLDADLGPNKGRPCTISVAIPGAVKLREKALVIQEGRQNEGSLNQQAPDTGSGPALTPQASFCLSQWLPFISCKMGIHFFH